MVARKNAKGQLRLPKEVVERFRAVECFEVRIEEGRIILVPIRADGLRSVQARVERLNISEQHIRDAINWARRPGT